jgi:hypothetical protein
MSIRKHGLRIALGLIVILTSLRAAFAAPGGPTGPVYDHDRAELGSILDDLVAWLPGEWSSAAQIHYERTVRMPAEGEHEPWWRTFARIDAPQLGAHVFYGQINIGARDGPLYARSQVLYVTTIDEKRGVVLMKGQLPADAEKYVNLQDHPELWKQVRQRDPADIKCDFVWFRDGAQIVGVLDGPTPERRINGPGTCSYTSNSGKPFVADAEWALSPETFWLYDTNKLDGVQFIGRKDRTHTKLERARPYRCTVQDAAGSRDVDGHDRGAIGDVTTPGRKSLQWRLLRARLPAADGGGIKDRLRLALTEPDSANALEEVTAEPQADRIELKALGVAVYCALQDRFGPMPASG